LSLPLAAVAQSALPAGTLLPVSLDTSLNSRKAHPGQPIQGTIMQNIPGTSIRRGAKVLGQVVQVTASQHGPARVEMRFDTLKTRQQRIPLQVNLRALASFLEVEEAEIPEESASRGITPDTATTRQIGGEQVYRGGGPVASGDTVVGHPVPYGVLVTPRAQPGMPCRGSVAGNRQPQALWLFSSDACGVYGYGELHIAEAGRDNPAGEIVLATDKGRLLLRSGTGLLLRVQGSQDGRSRSPSS
ncbi:MAG: hypothetical protein WCA37_06625, partial [Terracidiphilus sp.]